MCRAEVNTTFRPLIKGMKILNYLTFTAGSTLITVMKRESTATSPTT